MFICVFVHCFCVLTSHHRDLLKEVGFHGVVSASSDDYSCCQLKRFLSLFIVFSFHSCLVSSSFLCICMAIYFLFVCRSQLSVVYILIYCIFFSMIFVCIFFLYVHSFNFAVVFTAFGLPSYVFFSLFFFFSFFFLFLPIIIFVCSLQPPRSPSCNMPVWLC